MSHQNPFHSNMADLAGASLLGAKLDRKVSHDIFIFSFSSVFSFYSEIISIRNFHSNFFRNFQTSKPLMEKRRRERINRCLEELKKILLEALRKDVSKIQIKNNKNNKTRFQTPSSITFV